MYVSAVFSDNHLFIRDTCKHQIIKQFALSSIPNYFSISP